MAALLARTHGLVTLWVQLVPGVGGAHVTARLDATVDGERQTVLETPPAPLADYGLDGPPEYLGDSASLNVPTPLLDAVRGWYETNTDNGPSPLWVRLVPPFGLLGAVPWERDFVDTLDVPVIRLPDFLEPPRESAGMLQVAVVATVPGAVGKGAVVSDEVRAVVDALLAGAARPVRVHLFADAETANWFREHGGDATVVYDVGNIRRLGWLAAVEDGLTGAALDGVHFVTHGVPSADGALLAVGVDALGGSGGGYYSAREVTDFLNRVGAWAVGIHVPWAADSDIALRLLADDAGELRPGSVLFHDGRNRTQPLDEAMALLYAPEAQQPPLATDMFFYVQPRRVRVQGEPESPPEASYRSFEHWEPGADSPYVSALDRDEVPAFVAATERFADKAKLVLGRANDSEAAGVVLDDSDADVLDATVAQIKLVVAEYVANDWQGPS